MSPLTGSSSRPLPVIAGYTIIEQLYSGSRTAVYRGIQDGDQRSVVLKILLSDYPTFGELVQFRNQYAIAKNLSLPGIIHPLTLQSLGNGYVLVMEDWGGLSLNQYLQQHKLNWVEVLKIALQLTTILHDLHQQRVIHKDIKPANILINPESKEIKLIDFSIASLLPKETQEIQNPNILEGTLAYLAPEQTGRMNRGIDYRTDYYSLGVTLYQLLTIANTLPFISNDPLELLHCHIAKTAQPVDQVNPSVPKIVGLIVAKLMAKNAEDRYQSALGLQHDLQQCLSQWEATGKITEFELGQRDLSDRFLIPEKLYGRESEVQILLKSFERVSQGASELMLVAGFSGIGKTAVVNEVHKPITQQKGYFIKGKFDQFNRNIPLSAFVQALRDLMGQLLSESDAQLAQWKNRILEAVGDNGEVLIEVIPELEQVIGHQPAVPELSGTAAQNRFNLLFQKFIQVFTTANHPLVIFLDDLQWSDSASLQLLKVLMESSGYLLVLGAYRDNEVSPVHPLMLTIGELKKASLTVNTITLLPLSLEHTNCLVADTLKCSQELSKPLTQLVDRKTQGNPFFTTQFLKALHEDGYIVFDRDQGYWQCDIAQVNALTLTDDVVEFMALQLQKLPAATQEVLKLAACIGAQFDLQTLAIVAEQSQTEAATILWRALQEGLIIPITQVYKFFQSEELEQCESQNHVNPTYRFLHDRVQQAAYSLIAAEQKQATHLKIGQLLLSKRSPDEIEERIFELVGQLNHGQALIGEQSKRDELARLNLIAAHKARITTAYQGGREYVHMGLSLLGEAAWERQYEITLVFYELAAELASLCGYYEAMEAAIDTVIEKAHSVIERVNVYRIRIVSLISQNKLLESIDVARNVLGLLDLFLPETMTEDDFLSITAEVNQLIGDRDIEDLVDLPKMTDRRIMAIVEIITRLFSSAYISGSSLYIGLVTIAVKLSIEYGNTPASIAAYSCYSIIAANFLKDVNAGVKFIQLAIQLTSTPEAKVIKPEAFHVAVLFTSHRKFHVRDTLPLAQEGYTTGLDVGNIEYGGYNVHAFCANSFWCGSPLDILELEIQAYHQALVQMNQLTPANWCRVYWQGTLNLRGNSESAHIFSGEVIEEAEFLPQLISVNDLLCLYAFYVFKLMLCCLFDELEMARMCAVEVRRYFNGGVGTVGEAEFYLYDSLAALAALERGLGERSQLLQQVEENQTKLQQQWASYAPMNYQHKFDLVAAEHHRVLGNFYEAGDWYDRAISGAKESGYIQEEALANELAAKFYLKWGKETVAAGYMQNAYYAYAHWGAKAKVVDLEKHYPQLLRPILQAAKQPISVAETLTTLSAVHHSSTTLDRSTHSTSKNSSSSNINRILDLSALLQVSQIIASTIALDKLLETLTQIMLENSGADRCALMLGEDDQWQVRVTANLEEVVLQAAPLEDASSIPSNLIQYVKNTATTVVIDDLKTDLPVIGDYLNQRQPKSILCLPMLNQSNLRAILYLENCSTSGVFTSDRIAVLNFLCIQAAISLENASLYQKAQLYAQQAQRYAQQLEQSQLQMVQSEKMASLGNLVAGVAHEINNPIGFLNGSIDNGKEHVQDLLEHLALYQQHYPSPTFPIQDHAENIDLEYVCEDLPQLLNSMQGATDRIKSISTSLRTFSRADTEYKVSANLHEGIDSTLLILKYRLKANANRPAIEVVTNYGEIPPIDCFPGQLNQVFMNILANAIDVFDELAQGRSFKELEAHPQQITISTTLIDDQVQITIRDNGKGMNAEVQSRIFDHLFTTKSVGKGTGLGLAIAQQIVVDKHSGSLTVESEPGQGAAFRIQLPIEG
ncbi:AAA family ATPase [Limnothrix sp. FACHB-881]|uniref:trifunctional serine/threonine-protein kinase/ATP-binding protein/sensor histidine kinase n=1 Tax=Limnothrix sp. FACHB-881 TaxID=2692819 RepID=UPI001683E595|nr:ATP-binding sensor histidine kinase [Limnothrix sp. FACHB-881]MBD2635221.1 AAA family ATPase [Limnothrix sp. FACHB-881]